MFLWQTNECQLKTVTANKYIRIHREGENNKPNIKSIHTLWNTHTSLHYVHMLTGTLQVLDIRNY